MFWETFYNLCQDKSTKPLNVVKELDLATGSITKWKNGSIPNGKTLQKIADHFEVSVDYLLGNSDTKEKTPAISESDLTEEELELVQMFRSLSEESKAIIMGGVRNAKQSPND